MKFIILGESRRESIATDAWTWHSSDNVIDRFINTDRIIDVLNDDDPQNIHNVFYLIYRNSENLNVKIMCFGDIEEFSDLIEKGGKLKGRFKEYLKIIRLKN